MDGRPLFPERRAYAVKYALSDAEAYLYNEVTTYVREEMNRADRLANEQGQGRRRIAVGFALTTLQRRLASSPEAIYQSLKRRRKRLEAKLDEEKLLRRGAQVKAEQAEVAAQPSAPSPPSSTSKTSKTSTTCPTRSSRSSRSRSSTRPRRRRPSRSCSTRSSR